MNTQEITTMLRRRCRGTFLGVYARDRLPERLPNTRPLVIVCNTESHDHPGRHWIVLYLGSNSVGEYFDSLNQPPIQTFANYLKKMSSSWTTNSRQLQSAVSRFCGQYCIFYVLFRNLDCSLNAIESCFTNDTGLNDILVHAIVYKLT